MATSPSIVIAGYYGFGNWGDEAALGVLVHHVRAALPQAQLVVLSNDPAQTVQLHHTRAINRWNLLKIHGALSRAAAFVLGPGSLLQDITSTRSLLYYLGLLRWAQRYHLPTYLIGQGIGPLSPRAERWVAHTLRQARLILTRDQASSQWASVLGIHTVLGEDLAVLMSEKMQKFTAAPQHGSARARLGVSLRPGLSHAALSSLSRALHTLTQENFELVFLPFQSSQDLAALRDLTAEHPLSIPSVEARHPGDLMSAMQSLDIMIGMRLHSLVFALICDVPFCALSYDPKIENFMRRIEEVCDYPVQWWSASEALDEEGLVRHILELYAKRAELRERLQRALMILRTKAQQSLDETIRGIAADLRAP